MTKKAVALLVFPSIILANVITFEDALSLTMQNSKELKAKKLSIATSEQSLAEADAYNYGKLAFNGTVTNTNNAGHVFGMKLAQREASFKDFGFSEFSMTNPNILNVEPNDLNYPDARTNVESKLSYDIPLFTGFKLQNAKDMAKLQILATKAKYSHDNKQIGLQVLQAYNGAVAAKEFISMIENARTVTDRFVKTSQDMYENQLTRIIDVKQAKMAKHSISTKLKEAKTKFKLAISYLQFLTSDDTISDVASYTEFCVNASELETLQHDAIERRDDYRWMKYNTDTMKKKVDYENSSAYPTIGAHVEYSMNAQHVDYSAEKAAYLGAVGLSYTLFDGSVASIQKQKAIIEHTKTKLYFEHMKNGIDLEVKKNFLDFKTQESTLFEKEKTQEMSEDILAETEKVYRNNLKFRTNMMYLLMSLESMIKSQADVIMSNYELTMSSGRLMLSVGKSLKDAK